MNENKKYSINNMLLAFITFLGVVGLVALTGFFLLTPPDDIIMGQAELNPKRKVGNTPIMKIPTACEAITSRNRADSIGNQPLFNGNELNPYKATAYRNATIVKITV